MPTHETIREPATRVGISPDAMYKAVQEFRVPNWKRDGYFYIDPQALAALEFCSRLPNAERQTS